MPWYELRIYLRQPGGVLVGQDAPIFDADDDDAAKLEARRCAGEMKPGYAVVLYGADGAQLGRWDASQSFTSG